MSTFLKKLPKALFYTSIIVIVILLFIFIIKEYVSHVYYSEYKRDFMENGRYTEQQVRYLGKSLDLSPSNAEILFELGKLYIKVPSIGKGNEDKGKSYLQADIFFQESLTHAPTNGRYWATYAWYVGNKGETKKAIKYFEKAILLGSTDAYVHRLYARWCVRLVKKVINFRNNLQFFKAYKEKREKDEGLVLYYGQFINGISISTFLRTAQTEWDKALSLGTHMDKVANNSLADLKLLKNELDIAVGYYKKSNNKIMLTGCYFIKGDYQKAVGVLRSTIKGEKGGSRRKLVNAKAFLKEILKKAPANYQSFLLLGEIYVGLGQNENAIKYLKKASELNPKRVDAHLCLAKIYNLKGMADLAIDECETILSRNPNHKEATALLGEMIREEYKDAEFMKY